MIKTTWLEVFEMIQKETLKDGTKIYYGNNLYTYYQDDNNIWSINGDSERFYLDEILDTCYILADLNKEDENGNKN